MAARASGGSATPPPAARSSRSLIDASGLRTSCATPATTRPSAASRSCRARSRPIRSWIRRASSSRRASAPIPTAMSSSSRISERGTGADRSSRQRGQRALQPGGRALTVTSEYDALATSSSAEKASATTSRRQLCSVGDGRTGTAAQSSAPPGAGAIRATSCPPSISDSASAGAAPPPRGPRPSASPRASSPAPRPRSAPAPSRRAPRPRAARRPSGPSRRCRPAPARPGDRSPRAPPRARARAAGRG